MPPENIKKYVFLVFSGGAENKNWPEAEVACRCYENMQQIYRRTPMPKCDFNKVALQLY